MSGPDRRLAWPVRAAVALALLLGVLLLVLLFTPLAVDRDDLAEQVAMALDAIGVHQVEQAERPRVALLPRPHLVIGPLRGATRTSSAGPHLLQHLRLEQARADLALRPLLAGRLELARVTLTGLQVALRPPARPASAPSSAPESAPDAVSKMEPEMGPDLIPDLIPAGATDAGPAPDLIPDPVRPMPPTAPAVAPPPAPAPAAPPAPDLAPGHDPGLLLVHRLLIRDAQVRWEHPNSGMAFAVTDIELRAGPLALGTTAEVHATLTLRQQQPERTARLTLDAPLRLGADLSRARLAPLRLAAWPAAPAPADDLTGDPIVVLTSDLTLDATAGWLQIADLLVQSGHLQLSGAAMLDLTQTPLALDGQLALAPFDLRTWFEAAGLDPLPGAPTTWRRVAAAVDFALAEEHLRLPRVELELDASHAQATGWLRLSPELPSMGGFAAAVDQIDLDPYLAAAGSANHSGPAAPLAASTAPLPPMPELPGAAPGVALQLQAGALRLGRLQPQDVALTARHDPLAPPASADHLELHSSDFYQGRLHGQLHRTRTGAQTAPTLTLALTATGVAMTDLLDDLLPPGSAPALSGNGELKLDLQGQGETLADLSASLGGAARLSISDGRLTLADLDALLAAHVTAGGNPGTGAKAVTAFDRLSLSATGADGQFHSDDIAVQAPRYHLSGSADADVAAETLRLDLTAVLIEPPHAAARGLAGIPIPVAASGPWSALAWQVDLSPALAAAARRALQERGLFDELEERTGIPGLRQGLERGLERGLEQGLRGLFGR